MALGGRPAVQFVSKPIVDPFRDGSKCLVRDLCLNLEHFEPHVMTAGPVPNVLAKHARGHSIYSRDGGYAPGLKQNAQAAFYLAALCRPRLWHSVFAPNPRSSQILGRLARFRGARVVQTIASPPLSFDAPERLLFGDIVVAQSEWTRQQFRAAFEQEEKSAPLLVHIPPPAPEVVRPSDAEILRARVRRNISPEAPLFVYPGDLEVSQGPSRVLALHQKLAQQLPGAKVLLVYRDKTKSAQEHARRLAKDAQSSILSLERNVDDLFALMCAATAIVFPVESLYGKVDLPIVLLEAMRLRTPVVAWAEGPLKSLKGAVHLGEDEDAWLSELVKLSHNPEYRNSCVRAGLAAIRDHYEPQAVASKYESLYQDLLAL